MEFLGSGSFGQVVKAIHIPSGQVVAIKLMKNLFKDQYSAKRELSEINILRKLSSVQNNIFTTNIHDIIVTDFDSKSDKPISCIFIVMDLISADLKMVIKNIDSLEFEEDHMITLIYNILCCLNFLHSANIVHRDIKPANILVLEDC